MAWLSQSSAAFPPRFEWKRAADAVHGEDQCSPRSPPRLSWLAAGDVFLHLALALSGALYCTSAHITTKARLARGADDERGKYCCCSASVWLLLLGAHERDTRCSRGT